MEKHKRRFVILSIVLFTFAFILHGGRLILGLNITVGEFLVPQIASTLLVLVMILMIWMGIYYLRK